MQIKTLLPVVLAAVATASPVANPNYKTSAPEAQYPTTTEEVKYSTSTPETKYPTTTEYSTSTPEAQYPTTTEEKTQYSTSILETHYSTSTPAAEYPTSTPEVQYSTSTPETYPTTTQEHKPSKTKKAKHTHTHTHERKDYPATTYAAAAPSSSAPPSGGLSRVCPGSDTPLCCQVDVDGIIDLTCASPGQDLDSIEQFTEVCAADGLTAECCVLPLLGDALLCTAV